MTVFVIDLSHYDGSITQAELRSWLDLGVIAVTHKIGEGLANDDPLDGPVLTRARAAGIPVLGGYFIPHQGINPVAEARRCVALADRDEPWWRTFPYWFWQCDAERWSGNDRVTRAEIRAFCDELVRLTGRRVIVYASRGQYGDDLVGLPYALWNANYGANPGGSMARAYALRGGDSGPGWAAYSGQTPVLWQFGSASTVGHSTTTDASAWRGTLAQFQAFIGGDPMSQPTPVNDLAHSVWTGAWKANWSPPPAGSDLTMGTVLLGLAAQSRSNGSMLSSLASTVLAQGVKLDAILTAVQALAGALGGAGDHDPAAGVSAAELAAAHRALADALDPPAPEPVGS
jgi:GH25 family lysozyme M1 (1,4-beta-N-acetylmuramidase)